MLSSTILAQEVSALLRETPFTSPQQHADNETAIGRLIYEQIESLGISTSLGEKLSTISAMEALFHVSFDDILNKVPAFCSELRTIIMSCNENYGVIQEAARALGTIAKTGGSQCADSIENEVHRALDGLQTERKLSGCLVLTELCVNSPVVFYGGCTSQFIYLICDTIFDKQYLLRVESSRTIDVYRELVGAREGLAKTGEVDTLLYSYAEKHSKSTTPEILHGSILLYGILLKHSHAFLSYKKCYPDIIAFLLKCTEVRDRRVKQSALETLGHLGPNVTMRDLHSAMAVLVGAANTNEYRKVALLSIGRLAMETKMSFVSYADSVMDAVNTQKSKYSELYDCIVLLAKASAHFHKRIIEFLPKLFGSPFSAELVKTLLSIADSIAPQSALIHCGVLELARRVLSNQTAYADSLSETTATFDSPALPFVSSTDFFANRIFASPFDDGAKPQPLSVVNAIITALYTVSKVKFFTEFDRVGVIEEPMLKYLRHPNPYVRHATVCSLKELLKPLPLTCVRGLTIINHAVGELALLCATDPDPNVRVAALCAAAAAPRFLLVQQRPLMLFFSSLGDEHFTIRKRALELIGDLAAENSAVVTPLLRRYLIDLLTKIEYSHDHSAEEEGCLLLTTLLTKVPLFVAPFSEVILKKLLPNLRSPSAAVATAALSAISAISKSGGNVSRHYDEIIPFIVESLRDQGSSSKRIERREIALQSLSQITRNTGNVVEPLVKFKDLFDVLLNDMVTAERSVDVKRELYKALGVLGAVDPYLFKKAAVPVHQTIQNEEPQDGAAVENPTCLTSSEDYYPTVVLTSLIKILSDANLATHHKNALPDIIRCLRSLSPNTIVSYLPVIMKTFSTVVQTCDSSFREQMFNFIATVVFLVKQHIRPYLEQIFEHIFTYWESAIVTAVIPLTEALAVTLAVDFKRYLPQYLPLLLKEITRYRHQRILSSLIAFGSSLEDHLNIVVPALLRVLDDEKSPMNMIAAVFATFGKLVDALNLETYYSRLLVSTVRVLNHERTNQTLFLSICFLVSHMLQKGVATDHLALVLALIDRLKEFYQPKFVAYERIQELENVANVGLYKLPGQVTIPPVMATIPGLEEVIPFTRAPKQSQGLLSALDGSDGIDIKQAPPPPKKLTINTEILRSALDLSMQKPTKEVWYEWHRQFCAAFLRESPCSAIRTCQALALDYPPLLRALFNSSFMSCYRELPESFRVLIANRLQSALQSPTIPPEVMQSILDLAEFMDREGQTKDRLSIPNLGELASKCKADGKALRYKEREFRPFVPQEKNKLLEDLIELNSNLNQPDAAFGVLRSVQKHYTISIPETCLEKLGEWKEAYGLYKARLAVRPDIQALLGSFRCLHSLCRWEELGHNVAEAWQEALKQLRYTQSGEPKSDSFQANSLYQPQSRQQNYQQGYPHTASNNNTKALTELTKSELETFLSELAPFGASAMLNLADWEKMKPYVEQIHDNTKQKTFYQAILSIYEKDYDKAEHYFATAREDIDTEFTALISESYDRSYSTFVYLQQIAELEEMTEFWKSVRSGSRGAALAPDDARAQEHAGKERLRELWDKRLKGVKRDIDVWANLLKVRPLFFSPQADMKVWIKFANLCRKNHRVDLTKQVLYRLLHLCNGRLSEVNELGDDDYNRTLLNCTAHPKVTITYLRTLWQESSEDVSKKYVVLRYLEDFYTEIPKSPENKQVRSKLSLLMGKYLLSISQLTDTFEQNSARILEAIKSSTENSGNSAKCWHAWAMANIAVIDFYEVAFEREKEQLKEGQAGELGEKGNEARALQFKREKLSRLSAFHAHAATRAVDAISAFSRAATLTKGIRFQDTLRLLSLLFKYGDEEKVVEAGREAIQSMGIDALVQVIPQVIARIHTQLPGVANIIKEILSMIGKSHPQTLIFPLLVAMNSYKKKSHIESLVISELQTHSSILYADSVMFCDELNTVGCTIEETWAEAIDQASREYFSNKNPDASLRILLPLHAQLEKGPTTLRENAFFKEFDSDLRVAHQWIKKYESKRNEANFSDAWQIYVKVFRKMSKNIKEMTSINLNEVSPKLYAARNLQTAVPGTYRIGEPVIHVQSIVPVLPVIASKQKPRKLFIKGDNGHVYKYLLKGHEDLRQDERVMQLLSLVNGLLAVNPETARDRLEIGIFDVVPLTTNTGLICWVTDSDTFHQLIQEHRAQIGLHLNFEYLAMKEMCDAFMEKLTVLQKVELLRHAFAISSGTDLEQSLWKKSPNSEVWLERRTVYTRSLAVMSMVGYVLGVGDRHPSNLMMSRNTGLVTHIDFGDCFEVAQHREKYPEKIPFRLTRMLVLAMEVCGVEGTFRLTCQRVLNLLRENKDSFLTVLETFIYDPLINWRLNKESGDEQPSDDGKIPPEMAEMSTFQGITDLPVSLNYRKQVVLTDEDDENEKVNEKALKIVKRVTMKLTGRFDDEKIMEIPTQVDMLIKQATLHENLAQCYGGWCPYW